VQAAAKVMRLALRPAIGAPYVPGRHEQFQAIAMTGYPAGRAVILINSFTKECNMKKHAIDIGINEKEREQIADGLKVLLADSYTLYLQTHNFHWNVTGPQFRELHLMFEEQYTELATAVDLIAERIRTLGVYAPGTYKAFAGLSNIKEIESIPSAGEMLTTLTRGHEQIVKTCRAVLKPAQKANDESTTSLVSDRMRLHEKTAWMLRSMK
jgi:starvation-inducible DNA-binding protein